MSLNVTSGIVYSSGPEITVNATPVNIFGAAAATASGTAGITHYSGSLNVNISGGNLAALMSGVAVSVSGDIVLVVSGGAIQVSGLVAVSSGSTLPVSVLSGAQNISGGVTVSGGVTISGGVTVSGNINVLSGGGPTSITSGGTIPVSVISGAMNVSGGVTISGGVTVSGSVSTLSGQGFFSSGAGPSLSGLTVVLAGTNVSGGVSVSGFVGAISGGTIPVSIQPSGAAIAISGTTVGILGYTYSLASGATASGGFIVNITSGRTVLHTVSMITTTALGFVNIQDATSGNVGNVVANYSGVIAPVTFIYDAVLTSGLQVIVLSGASFAATVTYKNPP